MDVTDRRQNNAAFHQSPNLLAVVGLDGTLKVVNQAWERLLGYQLDELVGKQLTKLVDADERLALLKLLNPTASADIELALRGKDGTYKAFAWQRRLIPSENSMFLTGVDVTQKKQLEVTDNLKLYQLYAQYVRDQLARSR